MIIPENLLSKMSATDRKQFGKAGRTMPEHIAEYSLKLERDLHNDFSGFLKRHEFDLVIHTSPAKKSPIKLGWPDYTIFKGGKILFIEFKVGANVLSEDQRTVIAQLLTEGFTVRVLYSYTEAVKGTLEFFELAADELVEDNSA
jgi:hypothetical protein